MYIYFWKSRTNGKLSKAYGCPSLADAEKARVGDINSYGYMFEISCIYFVPVPADAFTPGAPELTLQSVEDKLDASIATNALTMATVGTAIERSQEDR